MAQASLSNDSLEKRRDKLKREIRSFCISAAHNLLTVEDLRRDYWELLATKIEDTLLECCYGSLDECLEDMDGEWIQVEKDWRRGTFVLKAVTGSDTKHLEQLIMKQKVRNKASRFNVKGVSVAAAPSRGPSGNVSRPGFSRNISRGARGGVRNSQPLRRPTLPPQQQLAATANRPFNSQRFGAELINRPVLPSATQSTQAKPPSIVSAPIRQSFAPIMPACLTISYEGSARNVSVSQTPPTTSMPQATQPPEARSPADLFDYLENRDSIDRIQLWPRTTVSPKNVVILESIRKNLAIILANNPAGLDKEDLLTRYWKEFRQHLNCPRDCNCTYTETLKQLENDILQFHTDPVTKAKLVRPSQRLMELAQNFVFDQREDSEEDEGNAAAAPIELSRIQQPEQKAITVEEFFQQADQILISNPRGLTPHDFDDLYEKAYGRPVPIHLWQDCFDSMDVMENHPERFTVVHVTPKVTHVFHPKYRISKPLAQNNNPPPPQPQIPARVEASFPKNNFAIVSEDQEANELQDILLRDFPQGLPIQRIREIFHKYTGRLFPRSDNIQVLTNLLCDNYSELFLCHYEQEDAALYVSGLEKFEDEPEPYGMLQVSTAGHMSASASLSPSPIPTCLSPFTGFEHLWNYHKDTQFDVGQNKAIFFSQMCKHSLPEDICDPRTTINWKTPDFGDSNELDVFVTRVISPAEFFVVAGSSSHHLQQLLLLMGDLYGSSNSGDAYCVPAPCFLVPNLPVAVNWEGMWQRALILKTDFVKQCTDVIFVDCGACIQVPVDTVRFLPNRFAKLPFQNIHCRLADVSPAMGSNGWSVDATAQFCVLTSAIQPKAKVVYIQGEFIPQPGYILPSASVTVQLFTMNEEDLVLSVGEQLVDAGLAMGPATRAAPPPGFSNVDHFSADDDDDEEWKLIAQEVEDFNISSHVSGTGPSGSAMTPDLTDLLESLLEGLSHGLLQVAELEFAEKLLTKKSKELHEQDVDGNGSTEELRHKIELNEKRLLCFRLAVQRYKKEIAPFSHQL